MRTTIDIEDDVLAAAKELARMQNVSAGQIVSQLVRQALAGPQGATKSLQKPGKTGFRPFPSRGVMVNDEQVNLLRDQEGV
ncbi:MAG: CopG family transcriptional regulator [Gallionella sp.]